jgi:hypothetical protein
MPYQLQWLYRVKSEGESLWTLRSFLFSWSKEISHEKTSAVTVSSPAISSQVKGKAKSSLCLTKHHAMGEWRYSSTHS